MNTSELQQRMAPIQKEMPKPVSSALISVLGATAFLEMITPISEGIRKDALDKFKPVVEDSQCGRITESVGKVITRWDDLYLASDDAAKELYDFHKREMALKGFKADGECCPFLVAESTLREAKRILFSVMEPYTGIAERQILRLDTREKYLQILLSMLVPVASQQGIELNILKTK
ncbi:hypothetical protein [Pseudoalteromonas rhizosphaerae]|jgi:hypothetical protein|uniref:hypothetical protein n=1 Tax=Pseudoalteromonas lipolytica TaxID=570156 RepID=UPI0021497EC3